MEISLLFLSYFYFLFFLFFFCWSFPLQTNLIYSCNFFMPNLRASGEAAAEAELSRSSARFAADDCVLAHPANPETEHPPPLSFLWHFTPHPARALANPSEPCKRHSHVNLFISGFQFLVCRTFFHRIFPLWVAFLAGKPC